MRDAAAEALEKIGAPAVKQLIETHIETLKEAVKGQNWTVRGASTEALKKIGAPAVEQLIETLKNNDSPVRYAVVEALERIGDAQVVGPLIEALKDNDYSVRYAAAKALGRIGDEQVVGPLIEVLKDNASLVRMTAADALSRSKLLMRIDNPRVLMILLCEARESLALVREALEDAYRRRREPFPKITPDDYDYAPWLANPETVRWMQKSWFRRQEEAEKDVIRIGTEVAQLEARVEKLEAKIKSLSDNINE